MNDPDQIWNADETGCPLSPKSGRVLVLCGAKDVYQVTGTSAEQVTNHFALLETLCHQCTSLQENGSKSTPWMGVYPTATLGNHRRGGSQQSFSISG